LPHGKTAARLCLVAIGYFVAATGSFGAHADGRHAKAAAKAQAAGRTIPADVKRVSRLLSLNPCDPDRSEIRSTLVDASANVGNPAVSCAIWTRPEDSLVIFSSSVQVDGARLPVVAYFSSRHPGRAPVSLIIDIIDGPGGDISPGVNDLIPFALARSGAVVVRVGYTGTSHGTLYPRPNFDVAVRQVLGYSRALRAKNPSGKLILMGQSLGGPIVAHAAASADPPPVDGVALVLPMLLSPDEAVANFARIIGLKPPAGARTVRILRRPSDPWSSGQAVPRPADSYDRFFPPGSRDRDLGSYLAGLGKVKILIAFGDTDMLVGLSRLEDSSLNSPNIRKLRLRGVGHGIDSRSASRVAGEILDYLL
jgi:predicted alpha/beta-hydrolase family hydrolase